MNVEHEYFAEFDRAIPRFDDAAAAASRERWDSIAKPRGSLGGLERAVTRLAGFTGDPGYRPARRCLLVLCADNGVAARGVSPAGGEVTAALAANLARGDISVCKMAAAARCDCVGVDMGMNIDLNLPGLLDRRVAAGTNDIAVGPAMSREQAMTAIGHGIGLAADMAEKGCDILAVGEVGIGNTTTSSAMTAALLGRDPAEVTGRGAGLTDEGVRRKTGVIRSALAVNRPDSGDPLDVLAKLGGFDIAGMAGVFLGGARAGVPVVVDGLISSVAALTAGRLCPASRHAMLASHVSAEPAAAMLLGALGLEPLIAAGMRLGEGSGAVALLPLLDLAYAVYDDMITYDDLDAGSLRSGPGK